MRIIEQIRGLWAAPAQERRYEGYVDQASTRHVAGWLWDPDHPEDAVDFEAVLPATGEILARARADQFKWGASNTGGGQHGFYAPYARALTAAEASAVELRLPNRTLLPRLENAASTYQPVLQVAMDIVDNCNLRCPFCLYDYSGVNKTNLMSRHTLEAVLRFAPYTADGNFWFSCLHEPTLHPEFVDFLAAVPEHERKKLFFTTNLAKRMPYSFFEFLADSGVARLNISLESMNPELYERMRKGARHRIFAENWNGLLRARQAGTAPPRLRYIVMAYKSNLAELPTLVRTLIDDRMADEVQLRYTYDFPHIAADFRAAELLDDAEWRWLAAEMAEFPAGKVQLVLPFHLQAAAADVQRSVGHRLPYRFLTKVTYDGTMTVRKAKAMPYEDDALEDDIATVNVSDITDVPRFLASLGA